MRVLRIIFTDLNAGVLPSPFRDCKRTHSSFCCAYPGRQSRAAGEGQQLSMLCNSCTLPSTGIAVLIALPPNNTQTRFRGEHVPGSIPIRQFRLKHPQSGGWGRERVWYVELSRAVLAGLRARAWSLVILLTRHFLCVSILCLFNSKRRISPLYKK